MFAIAPPIEPMLAKIADELPTAPAFLFEPKWDGFRAIVFRGASDVFIQSRDLRPLDRYFPELHDSLLERLPSGCVIDGEIVIAAPARAGLRRAADAVASGSLARCQAGEGNSGIVCRVRCARDRWPQCDVGCAKRASSAAGRSVQPSRATRAPDADDARSRRRARNGSSTSKAPAWTA